MEKTENRVFSIDNFLIFHVELFFPHNAVSVVAHRQTRLLETQKIIFWKMQTKCDLLKHFFCAPENQNDQKSNEFFVSQSSTKNRPHFLVQFLAKMSTFEIFGFSQK